MVHPAYLPIADELAASNRWCRRRAALAAIVAEAEADFVRWTKVFTAEASDHVFNEAERLYISADAREDLFEFLENLRAGALLMVQLLAERVDLEPASDWTDQPERDGGGGRQPPDPLRTAPIAIHAPPPPLRPRPGKERPAA